MTTQWGESFHRRALPYSDELQQMLEADALMRFNSLVTAVKWPEDVEHWVHAYHLWSLCDTSFPLHFGWNRARGVYQCLLRHAMEKLVDADISTEAGHGIAKKFIDMTIAFLLVDTPRAPGLEWFANEIHTVRRDFFEISQQQHQQQARFRKLYWTLTKWYYEYFCFHTGQYQMHTPENWEEERKNHKVNIRTELSIQDAVNAEPTAASELVIRVGESEPARE